MISDGLVFYCEDGEVIFNQYSFCELVKWNIVKFAGKTYNEASNIVMGSHLADAVKSVDDVVFFTHETPYHWAMLLTHGDMYWTRGIPYPEPCTNDEYMNWHNKIVQKYKIKSICEFRKI